MAVVQIPEATAGVAAGQVAPRANHVVYTKKLWTDEWRRTPYLEAVRATAAAAPSKSTAQFVWRFGRIKREDSDYLRKYDPKDLRDSFVRIELLGGGGMGNTDLWVGRIGVNNQGHSGTAGSSAGPAPAGDEYYEAFGLEHELDRNPIRGAFVTNGATHDDATDQDVPAKAIFIDRPLIFNEKFELGQTVLGNRSDEKVTRDGQEEVPEEQQDKVYVFAGEKGKTEKWSLGDIVRYLLAYFAPPLFTFQLGGEAATVLDGIVLPRVDLNGLTVFQALNRLIDRRRGLGWCLRLDQGGGSSAEVYVYSVLDEVVQFEDATIPANSEQYEIDLDQAAHAVEGNVSLAYDVLNRYGKIVVSGQQVQVCMSLSEADETLQQGWTTEEADAYKDGAGLAQGADGAPDKNDKARAIDKLAHVWTHYHVPRKFDWKAGNGEGGKAGKSNANPLVDENGRVKIADSKQAPIRNWGITFAPHLPLRRADAKEDTEAAFVQPFVVVYDEKDGKWVFADHAPGRTATLRMLDTTLGIEVRFHPAHVLARGVSGNDPWAGAKPSNFDPSKEGYDHRKMIATVAVLTDERLEVVLTIDKDGPLAERIMHIEVPDAALWYVVPNTVTGIVQSAGTLIRSGSGSNEVLLRDDSERLRKIAALAKAWVGKDRAIVELTANDLWMQYSVGGLVQTVGNRVAKQPVYTPITQVIWDLRNYRTTIRTNWGELDVTAGRSGGRKRLGF